ncbi:MAG: hypothetical protein LM557_03870 [Desulfurococcaceae archaeon]|nr:hypothetical protein [Desulfurococcaceae archaeon]
MEHWLEDKARIMASELKYARSVDTYLVKFSSLIYELEDQCLGDSACVVNSFRRVLGHPSLSKEISTLACHVDEVLHLVQEDPRFKNLRGYIGVFEEVLRSVACVSEKELAITRQPTFRVEREEAIVKPERQVVVIAKREIPLQVLLKIVAIVAVVLVVVGLLLFVVFK